VHPVASVHPGSLPVPLVHVPVVVQFMLFAVQVPVVQFCELFVHGFSSVQFA